MVESSISSALLNFGFGGAMCAAFIWFMFHFTTKVIPDMVREAKEELAAKRKEFLEALDKQNTTHLTVLREQQVNQAEIFKRIEQSWGTAVQSICDRVDVISNRIDALDLHIFSKPSSHNNFNTSIVPHTSSSSSHHKKD